MPGAGIEYALHAAATSADPDMSDPSDESKRKHLARRGTLHPHPEDVADPLFHDDSFFDRCDAVQVKYEMLRSVRAGARSITRAAADFGFSRPTYYEAQAAFERVGMLGLLPAKKGPRRSHKLSDAVMSFVGEQLEVEPKLTTTELAERIHEHCGVTVHPRSISRALKLERRAKKNR